MGGGGTLELHAGAFATQRSLVGPGSPRLRFEATAALFGGRKERKNIKRAPPPKGGCGSNAAVWETHVGDQPPEKRTHVGRTGVEAPDARGECLRGQPRCGACTLLPSRVHGCFGSAVLAGGIRVERNGSTLLFGARLHLVWRARLAEEPLHEPASVELLEPLGMQRTRVQIKLRQHVREHMRALKSDLSRRSTRIERRVLRELAAGESSARLHFVAVAVDGSACRRSCFGHGPHAQAYSEQSIDAVEREALPHFRGEQNRKPGRVLTEVIEQTESRRSRRGRLVAT